MTCPSLETVAAWVLGDLTDDEGAAFEEHYFGCEACFDRAKRMQELIQKLETSLPPILTADRLAALERVEVRCLRCTCSLVKAGPFDSVAPTYWPSGCCIASSRA